MIDPNQEGGYIVRHHPRDQVVIAVLSLLCVVLLMSSFAGINIFARLQEIIFGGQGSVTYWAQWAALIVAIGVYFVITDGNRTLEFENSLREDGIVAAHMSAHHALDRLDRSVNALRERQGGEPKA